MTPQAAENTATPETDQHDQRVPSRYIAPGGQTHTSWCCRCDTHTSRPDITMSCRVYDPVAACDGTRPACKRGSSSERAHPSTAAHRTPHTLEPSPALGIDSCADGITGASIRAPNGRYGLLAEKADSLVGVTPWSRVLRRSARKRQTVSAQRVEGLFHPRPLPVQDDDRPSSMRRLLCPLDASLPASG